jgi:hypothetical protein
VYSTFILTESHKPHRIRQANRIRQPRIARMTRMFFGVWWQTQPIPAALLPCAARVCTKCFGLRRCSAAFILSASSERLVGRRNIEIRPAHLELRTDFLQPADSNSIWFSC